MKISKVIFHIKPIPFHPWWECKKLQSYDIGLAVAEICSQLTVRVAGWVQRARFLLKCRWRGITGLSLSLDYGKPAISRFVYIWKEHIPFTKCVIVSQYSITLHILVNCRLKLDQQFHYLLFNCSLNSPTFSS